MLVLASHPGAEDIEWAQRQPYMVVLMLKHVELGHTLHNTPFEKAMEADCYLKFILDHYDDLPPRIIFAHNHESSWHTGVGCCVPAN